MDIRRIPAADLCAVSLGVRLRMLLGGFELQEGQLVP
jgi:hypothetical protein